MTSVDHDIAQRCPYCGAPVSIVWVHGHGQCSHCGINTDECCRGECHMPPPDEPREQARRESGGSTVAVD